MEPRDCFIDEEELNLFIDNELSPERKLELNQHLYSCAECEHRYEIASGLKAVLKESSATVIAPAWLRERILEQINNEATAKKSRFWDYLVGITGRKPFAPVVAAGSLVAVLMLFVFMGNPFSNGNMPFIHSLVEEHYEYIENPLNLGIKSNDITQISSWLTSESGMDISLPSDDNMPVPGGACVLEEDGETIGYVFFDQSDKRVSLFMFPDTKDKLFGQRDMSIDNISLHCGKCTGMNYVLWKNKDLICVLVSDMPEKSLVLLAEQFI
jgi:mycothiol system anti-sigma-R factor